MTIVTIVPTLRLGNALVGMVGPQQRLIPLEMTVLGVAFDLALTSSPAELAASGIPSGIRLGGLRNP